MTPNIIAVSAEAGATAGGSLLFGLSPADAGIFGAMIAGAIMAFLGMRKGEETRKLVPPETPYAAIGAALIDRGPLQDLTAEVKDAIAASREQTAAIWAVAEAVSKFADTSQELARNTTRTALEDLGDKVDRLILNHERKPTGQERS